MVDHVVQADDGTLYDVLGVHPDMSDDYVTQAVAEFHKQQLTGLKKPAANNNLPMDPHAGMEHATQQEVDNPIGSYLQRKLQHPMAEFQKGLDNTIGTPDERRASGLKMSGKPYDPELVKTYDDKIVNLGVGAITAEAKAVKALKTEFEQAHAVAQRNAALPVSEGGLGLPPDNTAMDRAKAMGYTEKMFHGGFNDINAFDPMKTLKHAPHGKGTYLTDSPADASDNYANPASKEVISKDEVLSDAGISTAKSNEGVVYPLLVRKGKTLNLDENVGAIPSHDASVLRNAFDNITKLKKGDLPSAGDDVKIELINKGVIDEDTGEIEKGVTLKQLYDAVHSVGNELWQDDPVSGSIFASEFLKPFGIESIQVKPDFRSFNGVKNEALSLADKHVVSLDPSNIRSVNAAFDPMKRNSANILAGAGAGAAAVDLATQKDDKIFPMGSAQ